MQYSKIQKGLFQDRPNRFIAHVWVDGVLETVHVKNTGRCKELLLPESIVYLEESDNPARKTKYDLIAVEKRGFGLINMDSQAPNRVMAEWLATQNYTFIKPEYTYENSRIDFYLERNDEQWLVEVKGCTLEKNGIGYFPDAPTQRGVKHLRELIKATERGYHCAIAFVIQMEGITEVLANIETDREFAKALDDAKQAGVEIWYMCCKVAEDRLEIVAKYSL